MDPHAYMAIHLAHVTTWGWGQMKAHGKLHRPRKDRGRFCGDSSEYGIHRKTTVSLSLTLVVPNGTSRESSQVQQLFT